MHLKQALKNTFNRLRQRAAWASDIRRHKAAERFKQKNADRLEAGIFNAEEQRVNRKVWEK